MAYEILEWEKFKGFLRKIRSSKWDPDVGDHIPTLIMERRNCQTNPDDDVRKGAEFPNLLRPKSDKNISDKDIHVNEFIKFILRETQAKLCVIVKPLQKAGHTVKLDQLHEKYRSLSTEYIYPYKFSQNAEPFDFLSKLFKYKHYEATVRLFTNALLEYINQDCDLNFCLEEPLRKFIENDHSEQSTKDSAQKKERPNYEKPDYVIFYNYSPLGVVETKNARCLTRKSIIQCMKQLLALHEEEKEVKEQSGPLLGIVTDALHFIFIELKSDKRFFFEKDGVKDEIKVHRANTWDDLDSIAERIRGTCHAIKDTERGTPYWQIILNGNIISCYKLAN